MRYLRADLLLDADLPVERTFDLPRDEFPEILDACTPSKGNKRPRSRR